MSRGFSFLGHFVAGWRSQDACTDSCTAARRGAAAQRGTRMQPLHQAASIDCSLENEEGPGRGRKSRGGKAGALARCELGVSQANA